MANSKVRIALDANGNLRVGAGISKDGKDEVEWHNKTGMNGVIIDFGANSPFPKSKYGIDKDGTAKSGSATQTGTFKYTIKLAGKPDLDPHVIVDP
jgi:hypothetical protein